MPTPTTIGVDVGGTKLLALALDTTHDAVLGTARHPTPRGAEALLDGVAEVVAEITEQCALAPDVRVGVGVAGLVDHRGVLRHGPNQHGVRELDVLAGLTDRLGSRVVVDNDGNCAVWAEWSSGAARGHDDVVLVTLGTGIGAGVMVGGQVVRGRQRDGRGTGTHDGRPDRSTVPLWAPRLLGALRLRCRPGPDGPRRGRSRPPGRRAGGGGRRRRSHPRRGRRRPQAGRATPRRRRSWPGSPGGPRSAWPTSWPSSTPTWWSSAAA